jgi:hypothetical protein
LQEHREVAFRQAFPPSGKKIRAGKFTTAKIFTAKNFLQKKI